MKKISHYSCFNSLQVRSWSHTLSCWQFKLFPCCAWRWLLVSDWGKALLVCVIKFHATSAVLRSAVLSCI